MKVLFVLEYYHPYIGGVETLFQTLAESLVRQGHSVRVVSMRFKKELKSFENVNGVEVHRLRFTNRFAYALLSGFYITRAAGDADLIQTTSSSAGFPAVIAARLRRKKVVVIFHELWGKMWFKLPFMEPFTRVINFFAEQIIAHLPYNRITAVSEATRNSLIDSGISPDKIIRIYNGLDYDIFKGFQYQPPSDFTFTFFGRLGVSKGLDLLLLASKIFFQHHPAARLKLILPKTPKSMFRKIMKLIDQLDISSHIDLFHHLNRDDLLHQICSSHVVVIPSYSEGFGFTATEAIALGVPIISSGQKSLKEVVCGKYIEMEKQDVKSLSNALEQAYAGEWKVLPLKKFELSEQVKAYEKLYKQFI